METKGLGTHLGNGHVQGMDEGACTGDCLDGPEASMQYGRGGRRRVPGHQLSKHGQTSRAMKREERPLPWGQRVITATKKASQRGGRGRCLSRKGEEEAGV